MNGSTKQFDELGLLTAALCDGEITPQEAARLEQLANRSPQTRQYFLQYLRLHGELYWEHAISAGHVPLPDHKPLLGAGHPFGELAHATKAIGPAEKPAKRLHQWAATAAAAALLVVGVSLGAALCRHWLSIPEKPSAPPFVAQLTHLYEAEWGDRQTKSEGAKLAAGQQLHLGEGLAQIRFRSGARVILQGPTTFEVASGTCGELHAGTATANVPNEAAGFRIRTPSAAVVDRGTEFGVAVDENGASEVHVFQGTVQIRPYTRPEEGGAPEEFHAGQAVRIQWPAKGGPAQIRPIAITSRRFVRAFPVPGSVARLRALVAAHPNLIHHYTFEGMTPEEKCEDSKGNLRLERIVMRGGDGDGDLDHSARGADLTTNAVRPHRCGQMGNENGVGLVSMAADVWGDATFHPPPALTTELLLNFAGFPDRGSGRISAAVATRQDERDCGFFVAVAGRGRLVHLMQKDAPWVEGEIEFAPDEWYYVASTFRVESGETIINSYVANLSRGERTLQWVVKDHVAAGEPAASELGIGKGFAEDVTHAYPWSGALDEVAIYDAVLDQKTLQEHLDALIANRQSGR